MKVSEQIQNTITDIQINKMGGDIEITDPYYPVIQHLRDAHQSALYAEDQNND